jgi:hypothetical protein
MSMMSQLMGEAELTLRGSCWRTDEFNNPDPWCDLGADTGPCPRLIVVVSDNHPCTLEATATATRALPLLLLLLPLLLLLLLLLLQVCAFNTAWCMVSAGQRLVAEVGWALWG